MARYTVLRLLLFFGCVCALWLLQLRGLWLVIGAAALSMLLSLVLLRAPRQQFSSQVADRIQGRLQRHPDIDRSAAPRDEDIEDAQFPDGRQGRDPRP